MNIRHYLVTIALSTLLCWVSWILVLVNIDPFATNALGFGFFYVSLFFALVGTWAIVLFFVYKGRWQNQAPLFSYVAKSFREAIIIALFLTVALYLWGEQWLSWWTGSLLATAFVLVVSLFMSLTPRSDTPVSHSHHNFI
jgi:hypothetical protein